MVMALFFSFLFCLLFERNFGYVHILYKKESCKLNSCEWFLDIPVHFLNELIPVMDMVYSNFAYGEISINNSV